MEYSYVVHIIENKTDEVGLCGEAFNPRPNNLAPHALIVLCQICQYKALGYVPAPSLREDD